jgi:hypothetical protein
MARGVNVKYLNKDTGEAKTREQMFDLYQVMVKDNVIDDYGFDDFMDGATDINGQYKTI